MTGLVLFATHHDVDVACFGDDPDRITIGGALNCTISMLLAVPFVVDETPEINHFAGDPEVLFDFFVAGFLGGLGEGGDEEGGYESKSKQGREEGFNIHEIHPLVQARGMRLWIPERNHQPW